MARPLAISLILVAFFVGTGFGFFVTPEYAALAATGGGMGDAPADRLSDLRFINGLIGHHQQAVDLARQAKDAAGRPETRGLAEAVLSGMPAKIDGLYGWKKSWYRDSRRISFDRIALGTADPQFDLRYLNAMITHHREAIAMAGAALKTSTRNEVLTLASEVIRLDGEDLVQFEAWRSAWYGTK
jgi:uncharacterized protein (DUF305 family)